MKVAVILVGNSEFNPYLYGCKIVEKDFVSCYDARDAALDLIKEIFPAVVDLESSLMSHNITCTLGGMAQYKTSFKYKIIDHVS